MSQAMSQHLDVMTKRYLKSLESAGVIGAERLIDSLNTQEDKQDASTMNEGKDGSSETVGRVRGENP